MKFSASAYVASYLAVAFAAPQLTSRNPSCTSFKFSVSASTNVLDLLKADVTSFNDILAFINTAVFSLIPISGTYTLVGRYCPPTVDNQNKDTLQLLLHGITNNKNYWSGLGYPNGFNGDQFSWIAYAAKQGYPTLSIDRLGAGESDHPDPILVDQGPFEYHLYHDLINIIKAGASAKSPLPRAFQDIVLIGHSYGSEIINNMLQLFPNDVNKVILTGFSDQVITDFPGVAAQLPIPAAIADPARFANLAPGYLTSSVKEKRRGSFYGTRVNIDYPDGIFELDNALRDTVSVGQVVSVYTGQPTAPNYKGRVLVLTGINDNAFCGLGQPVPPMGADCRPIVPRTKRLFPSSDYNYFMPNNTGHNINNHFTSQQSFQIAHRFLAGEKFALSGF